MAIRRSKEKETINLPAKLESMLEKGFTEQFMASKFEELFKATKSDVKAYLEKNEDGFEVDLGKGFKCEQGTVIVTSRGNVQIDRDKLVELVESGKLSVGQLVACISTFKNEDLEKSLSTSVFDSIATRSNTESLTFRASAEYKAQMEEKMGLPTSTPIKLEEDLKPEAKPEAAKPAPKAALAAAKAAAAKAKAKTKTAESDLDDILGE